MRIGMMADVYKPHVSGITNYIALNKRFLEAAGHEVFVFTFGEEDYVDDEVNIIRSPGVPLVDTGYYLGIRYAPEAQKVLKTMDVVHVHHPFLSGRLALRYCKPRGIPIVFTNHTRYDLYAKAYLPYLPDGVGETFLKAYLPNFCHSMDLVIAPSQGMKEVLERVGVTSHIEVVPNGVDISPFMAEVEPMSRQRFGFDAQDVILVYAGRLGPEKNLPFLLRAFNGVAKAYENVHLLIVGDGSEYDNLVERVQLMRIASRVRFTGMVKYEEIPKYLAMSDAFVTASVTEVHPLSIIEALASGLPVLGIQSPGVGDTVEDGKTGFLVQGEDLAAFTAKMIRLVTDPALRERMGQQAREVAKLYAIERTTDLMLHHYQRLVNQYSSSGNSLTARLIKLFDRLQK